MSWTLLHKSASNIGFFSRNSICTNLRILIVLESELFDYKRVDICLIYAKWGRRGVWECKQPPAYTNRTYNHNYNKLQNW